MGFHEKRADAPTMPGDSDRVYASMGNYIFQHPSLLRELYADAANEESSSRFRARHSACLIGRVADVCLRLSDQRHRRRSSRACPSIGGTWEPSTHITTQAWICAQVSPSSISTTAFGRCARRATRMLPRSSLSMKRAERTSDRFDRSGGAILSGGVVQAVRARTWSARAHGRSGGGFRDFRQLRYRTQCQSSEGDPG